MFSSVEGSAGGRRVCYGQLLEKWVNFSWLLVRWSARWSPEEPQPRSTAVPASLPWVFMEYRGADMRWVPGSREECSTFLRWPMPAEGQGPWENQQKSPWGTRGFPKCKAEGMAASWEVSLCGYPGFQSGRPQAFRWQTEAERELSVRHGQQRVP